MSNFGELLAELRLDRKMTQKDLAKMLFVSVGTISNYEKGVHFPDIEKLIDLTDFFHVTTDYLLGRCASNLSPDVFSESVVDGKTVGDFVTVFRRLPTENKKALALIINEMEFCMTVRQYDKKESV